MYEVGGQVEVRCVVGVAGVERVWERVHDVLPSCCCVVSELIPWTGIKVQSPNLSTEAGFCRAATEPIESSKLVD